MLLLAHLYQFVPTMVQLPALTTLVTDLGFEMHRPDMPLEFPVSSETLGISAHLSIAFELWAVFKPLALGKALVHGP